MAETMVTDPVYLDQTAKENGKKLDQMTAALLGMSSSLGVIARAQTGVVEGWTTTPSSRWWLPVTHRRFSRWAPSLSTPTPARTAKPTTARGTW